MRIPWFVLRAPFARIPSSDLPPPELLRRVLLTRIQNLGDAVVFIPTVQAVRKFLPEATIEVLSGTAAGRAVFEMCPGVDRVISIKWPPSGRLFDKLDEVEVLRRSRYDAVLLSTEETGMAAKVHAAGIGFRAGFHVIHHMGKRHEEKSPHLLSRVLEQPADMHEVDVNLQLAACIGATDIEPHFDLRPDGEARNTAQALLGNAGLQKGNYCCVHPSTSQPVKKWPSESYARACDLVSRDMPVLFIGAAPDRETISEIRALMTRPSLDISGQTSVPELACIMESASVFLGNDSGPMHLAAAMGTPVAAMFVASDPKVWGPWLPPEKQRIFRPHEADPVTVAEAVAELARSVAG